MRTTFGWIAGLCAIAGAASAQETATSLEFEGHDWRIEARDAHVAQRLGREALALSGGAALRDDVTFSDGVIEYDVAFSETMGFTGVLWRRGDETNAEYAYLRPHLSGMPDALQYTPIVNGLSAWQIYSDAAAIAPVDYAFDEWQRVRVVVIGDKADIYVGDGAPVLHIPDLKADGRSGIVGLNVSGANNFTAYYSNVSFRALTDDDAIVGEAPDLPAPPANVIANWRVSSPFAESAVKDATILAGGAFDGLDWSTLPVETNGIANISRAAAIGDEADTSFARLTVRADKARVAELRFGYSDRARVYLNGKLVFSGDAGWRTRDYRFLGTVGFLDAVGLDLKKGENDLVVAVSEGFGGWAVAGALVDPEGLTVSP